MNVNRWLPITLALLALAPAANAKVQTKDIVYTVGDSTFHGHLAWNDSLKTKRPGILVVHEWWGLNEHARRSAERLAAAGYVALALDMFGNGKVAAHPQDAQAFAAEAQKDPEVTKARFDAARAELVKDPHVDPTRIGAIGYCFGGGVVLNMARAGEDLRAVATFHGALGTEHLAEKGKVKPRILVMTGTADDFVPMTQVAAFEKEMKDAGARFQVITYPGVKHSFTNPDAGTHGMPELKYDPDAARKSWASMLSFMKTAMK